MAAAKAEASTRDTIPFRLSNSGLDKARPRPPSLHRLHAAVVSSLACRKRCGGRPRHIWPWAPGPRHSDEAGEVNWQVPVLPVLPATAAARNGTPVFVGRGPAPMPMCVSLLECSESPGRLLARATAQRRPATEAVGGNQTAQHATAAGLHRPTRSFHCGLFPLP